jgi:hypothetical protein
MLRAEHIYLRPVRREDLPLLIELVNDFDYLTDFTR